MPTRVAPIADADETIVLDDEDNNNEGTEELLFPSSFEPSFQP